MATQITSSLSTNTSDPANKKSKFELLLTIPNAPTIQEQPIDRIDQRTWVQSIKANTVIYQKIKPTNNVVNVIEGTKLSWSILAGDASNLQNPNDTTTLKYFWRKDDASMVSVNSLNNSNGSDTIIITSESCTPTISGEYFCEVSNEYGTTISDSFTLNVFNVDNSSKFYTNLIKNGDGEGGLNTWNDGDNIKVLTFNNDISTRTNFGSFQLGGFITLRGLTDKPTGYEPEFRFSTSNHSSLFYPNYDIRKQLEPNFLVINQPSKDSEIPPAFEKWPNFNYLAQIVLNEDYVANDPNGYPYRSPLAAFFPGPYWMDSYNKNVEIEGGLTQDLTKGLATPYTRTDTPTYFTRNNIQFEKDGGDKSATFSQTVNLENLSDFINGNSYGVNSLESQFFAYVGAGITGYNVTLDTIDQGKVTTKYYLTDVENWYDSIYQARTPVFENGAPTINGNDLYAIVGVKDILYGRQLQNPKDSTILNPATSNARPIYVYNGYLAEPAPLNEYHATDGTNNRSRVQYDFRDGIDNPGVVTPMWHLSTKGDIKTPSWNEFIGINFTLPTKTPVKGLNGSVLPGVWGANRDDLEATYDIRGRLKTSSSIKEIYGNGGTITSPYTESYWKKNGKQTKLYISCSLKFQAKIDIVGPTLADSDTSSNAAYPDFSGDNSMYGKDFSAYGRVRAAKGDYFIQVALQKRSDPSSNWVNHKAYGVPLVFDLDGSEGKDALDPMNQNAYYNANMGEYDGRSGTFDVQTANDYESATWEFDFKFSDTIQYYSQHPDEWRVVLLSFETANVKITTQYRKHSTDPNKVEYAMLDRPWAIVHNNGYDTNDRTYNIPLPIPKTIKKLEVPIGDMNNKYKVKDGVRYIDEYGWVSAIKNEPWRIHTIPIKFSAEDQKLKGYTWETENADVNFLNEDDTMAKAFVRHYFMAGTVTDKLTHNDNDQYGNDDYEFIVYVKNEDSKRDYKKPKLSIAVLPGKDSYLKITAPPEEFDYVWELGIGGQKYRVKPGTNIEITPLVEDTTQIKIEFLNSTETVLEKHTIDGPDAKDVWAIKEKVYFPLTLNPIFQFVDSDTVFNVGNPITVFGQQYTHTKALAPWFNHRRNDVGFNMLEAGTASLDNAGRFKDNVAMGPIKDTNAVFLINKYDFGPYGSTYPRREDIPIGSAHRALYDHGAAAMFGVGKNIVIPPNTTAAKITVTFTHNSPIYNEPNKDIKKVGSELYGNIYDDSSKMGTQIDKKYFKFQEYGAPRCGITQMKFLVAPNSIETTGKHITYNIPPKKFTVLGLQREKYAVSDYFNTATLILAQNPLFNYTLTTPPNPPPPPKKQNPFLSAQNIASYQSTPNNINTTVVIESNADSIPPPIHNHGHTEND